ncbi:MAG: spore maturation protein [Oscillospiraceae bacterium]
MNVLTSAVVPVMIAGVVLAALFRGTDIFSVFVSGAKKGVGVVLRILPSLVSMLAAIYMLRASGLMDALSAAVSPVLKLLGIPPETCPLMLIRPLSGSGALAAGSDIIDLFGPDSLIGRTAAVMLGSTETTFYTISVYFGSLGIKNTRYAIPAALCADIAGFAAASFFTRLFFG